MTTAPSPTTEDLVARLLATEDEAKIRKLIRCARPDAPSLLSVMLQLDAAAMPLTEAGPRQMERICRIMLTVAQLAGEKHLLAIAYRRYGEVLQRQARNAEACEHLEQASAFFRDAGRPVDAARCWINWCVAKAADGDSAAAIKAAKAARRVLSSLQATLWVAAIDQALGFIYGEHGRYREALRHFTTALALLRSLEGVEEFRIAQCHHNRGLALTRLGRHREAIPELDLARDMYARHGQTLGAVRATRSMAESALLLGRYTAALSAFDAARAAYLELGMNAQAASLGRDLADCYLYLNRPDDALGALNRSASDGQGTNLPLAALDLSLRRFVALRMLDRREAAGQALRDAEVHSTHGVDHRAAWLAVQRAGALAQDTPDAAAVQAAEDAVRIATHAGIQRLAADALIIEGTVRLDLGDRRGAERAAGRALQRARSAAAAPMLARAYELLGRIAESNDQPALACRRYRTAIRQIEREQQGVIFEFRDSFATTRRNPYERLALLELQRGQPERSIAVAEQAKSRALSDAIAGLVEIQPRPGVSPAARRLSRELKQVREDYAAFSHIAQDPERPAEKRAVAADELPRLESRIAALIQQLQIDQSGAEMADLYGAVRVDIPSLQQGSGLVEYFTAGDDIIRYLVDDRGTHGEVLDGAVTQTERLLRILRLNLDAAEQAWRVGGPVDAVAGQVRTVLNRLYHLLLGGLDGFDTLRSAVIVPHGLLHYLPFHALFDGEQYLIERISISYAPSASLYAVCRNRHGRRSGTPLIMACSAGGALPGVIAEAEAVARVLHAPAHLEHTATRRVLQRAGSRASIIHVAAHGRFRADAPLFSAIDLADGPLTTADIFNLRFRAPLVTLSACETGRSVIGGGDELVGLTRAFLYAGAAGLLVSQWRVEDASTAALMGRFYTELASGCGNAEALRRAQRAFLTGDVLQNRRTHPFFWAGFQVIGDHGNGRTHLPQP